MRHALLCMIRRAKHRKFVGIKALSLVRLRLASPTETAAAEDTRQAKA